MRAALDAARPARFLKTGSCGNNRDSSTTQRLTGGNLRARIPRVARPQPFRYTIPSLGRLAQRLAQVLYTHKAGGSNPSSPTNMFVTAPALAPFPFSGPIAGDSNPRAGEGGGTDRSRRGCASIREHPSSPTSMFVTASATMPFLFQARRGGFEPAEKGRPIGPPRSFAFRALCAPFTRARPKGDRSARRHPRVRR